MKQCASITHIAAVIKNLQNPYLVSRFQNYFGIVRIESAFKCPWDFLYPLSPNGVHSAEKHWWENYPMKKEDKSCSYIIKNSFWYYVFSFGTSLGYELFYGTFFPFWTWNLDSAVSRKVVNVWVFVMYVGQALKEIIGWPRPSSPPVVHMESKYVIEYGMPSTHAMVGLVLPFSFLYFTIDRYDYPFIIGVLIAVVWCILVCCSRLYMGMHTVLDIIGGLLLAPILMLIILPFSESVDHFQQRSTYSPLITLIVMVFLQILYPKTTRWTPTRGDTSVIMGTGTGFAFGTWLNYYLGNVYGHYPSVPYQINIPSFEVFIMSFLRTVVGLLCILVSRFVFKNLFYFIFCYVMKLNDKNPASCHNSMVEIPSKFLTYIVIGFVIMFGAPWVFRLLGIERKSMHIEI